MPNWCYTCYRIYGDHNQLTKVYSFITRALETAPYADAGDPNEWLGQLVVSSHIDYNTVSCRGWIRSCVFNCEYIELNVEDAWGPHPEPIEIAINYALKDENEIRVCYDYFAEEPGCGVYINTDTTGKYFPERYKVEVFDDNDDYFAEEYFSNEEEMMNYKESVSDKSVYVYKFENSL